MGSVAKTTYRPSQYQGDIIHVYDENNVDVTPLPLTYSETDDEDKEVEEAIIDTFQDLEQIVRTTTESYIASLPEDKTPTPTSAAPTPEQSEPEDDDHVREGEDGEAGPDGEQAAGEAVSEAAASTPPPRIPTPILQALQAIRHYKPPPEPTTTFFLQETQTFWLLSVPSKCVAWEDEHAERLRREDGEYFWLTYDDGRLRHRHDAEAQTPVTLTKKRRTQTLAVHNESVKLFATEWDLYDTFRKVNIASRLAGRGGAKTVANPIASPAPKKAAAPDATTPASAATPKATPRARGKGWARLAAATAREAANRTAIIRIGEQSVSPRRRLLRSSKDLLESSEFRLAATICERLLASNSYRRRQEIFVGHPRLLARQRPTEFRYTVTRLFELYNMETQGMCVTGVAWNGKDRTILAVGYGCYLLSEDARHGLVCCWSIKNPFQPERIYRLDSAVTSLSFSSQRPNLLAVGVQAGHVYVVDVSLHGGDVVDPGPGGTTDTPRPCAVRRLQSAKAPMAYAPLWDVQWFTYTDFVTSTEEVLAVGDDGWVCKWNLDKDWESYPLCRVQYYPDSARPAGPAGADAEVDLAECVPRVLSGLCVALLPGGAGTRYLVATKEGVVAECHVHRRFNRPTLSSAHAGPVYAIRRSPFCGNLYLTAGADWTVSLWLRGWDEPIVKLSSPQSAAMESAAWSPTHATLIATASGKELQVWDIARRAASARPVAVVGNERGSRFTRVDWARDGMSLVSGDRAGHVWVHHLSELPHRARLAREALVAALSPLVASHRRPLLRDKLLADD